MKEESYNEWPTDEQARWAKMGHFFGKTRSYDVIRWGMVTLANNENGINPRRQPASESAAVFSAEGKRWHNNQGTDAARHLFHSVKRYWGNGFHYVAILIVFVTPNREVKECIFLDSLWIEMNYG
ncbi:hypothetical protein [Paenibacillus mucilaginosus]|uniref:hypothetical protein n=1 Tax=Paenibacillus mucilaginosus TaxID=61624 RepID=UPI00117D4F6B|nr:hypothetical protein [Paenibacillus mucilaginosus]MCG7213177.1 hypothetical protein [Paenibacillus mucilaginosus]WDM29653.1 hypothetical protein KCX80_11100 [Paenibacillus mucilaginosus]